MYNMLCGLIQSELGCQFPLIGTFSGGKAVTLKQLEKHKGEKAGT